MIQKQAIYIEILNKTGKKKKKKHFLWFTTEATSTAPQCSTERERTIITSTKTNNKNHKEIQRDTVKITNKTLIQSKSQIKL